MHVRIPRGAIARAIARGEEIQDIKRRLDDAASDYATKASAAKEKYANKLAGYLFGVRDGDIVWEGYYKKIGDAMEAFFESDARAANIGLLTKEGESARKALAHAVYKATEQISAEYRAKVMRARGRVYQKLTLVGGGI